jgi:hypothetical protein
METPEWVSVFCSRTSGPILEFLRQNPGFDVNSMVNLRTIPRMCPIKALLHWCHDEGVLDVLKELIASGLWLNPEHPGIVPLQLAVSTYSFACVRALIDAGAPVTYETLFQCYSDPTPSMLHVLLWQGLPDVCHVEQCYNDQYKHTLHNIGERDQQLCDYIAACRRRSATLAATLWVMTSYPPAIWRDLSEHVARRLADIPLEKFCV